MMARFGRPLRGAAMLTFGGDESCQKVLSNIVLLQGLTTIPPTPPSGFRLTSTVSGLIDDDDDQNPDFIGAITNVTAAVGKLAVLNCTVTDLGSYKVGWMKAEDGTILTVHTMVVTHNPRISVTQDSLRSWQLRIRHLRESDRGCYMCQINTSPMKKQLGCIDVHVPPDIVDADSSSDVEVDETGDVELVCKARGRPSPRIVWRREDGEQIQLISEKGPYKVDIYNGETLPLKNIDRKQMSAYLCIATNDVPPAVSKRIMVHVTFAPSVSVGQQLVGVPTGSNAKLECLVQAYPPAARSWVKNRGELIVKGENYVLGWERISIYEIRMTLVIKDFGKNDIGTYMCVASNVKGKSDGTIRLYEIKVTTTTPSTTTTTELTTTTTMEYITIPRFVVPLPQSEQKILPDVTTYDTMENIIEQSVVDNAWQATGSPHQEIIDAFSSGTTSQPKTCVLLITFPLFIASLYLNCIRHVSR